MRGLDGPHEGRLLHETAVDPFSIIGYHFPAIIKNLLIPLPSALLVPVTLNLDGTCLLLIG